MNRGAVCPTSSRHRQINPHALHGEFLHTDPDGTLARELSDRRAKTLRVGRVEEGRGCLGRAATLRFPSPLIKPDVPISGIRLSDELHREAHDEGPRCTRLRCSTPSFPKTAS
jgi:hypothetical protein